MRIYTKHFKKGRQMKKKYIVVALALLLVGCTNSTNNNNNQLTTKGNQQTSQIENTTKNIPTEETTTNTPEPTEEALAIRAVLKNERPYIDVNNGYKETYREDLNYYLGKNGVNIGWDNFTMFDVDNDGKREVRVIIRNLRKYGNHINLEDRTRLILRYYQGQVYGYQCSQIMGFGNSNYFVWNSKYYQYMEGDENYSGGGKIEFTGDKIKYIYYIREENEREREWLEGLIPGAEVEIIVDSQMCDYAESKCEKISDYEIGYSNIEDEIDKYIY